MLAFVIVLQVMVALFLIMVVLLQPGNRGGASAALGGAGSDTVFGARGANTFLSKITFGAAVCFMLTNFLLSAMSSTDGDSKVLKALEKTSSTKPATEAPAAAAPAAGAPTDAAPTDGTPPAAAPTEAAPPKAEGQAAPEAPPQEAPKEEPKP